MGLLLGFFIGDLDPAVQILYWYPMHKRLPKELVFFIATLRCHTGSLKEETRRLQCCNFAGIFSWRKFTHSCGVSYREKILQEWREQWCGADLAEFWLMGVPAWAPKCRASGSDASASATFAADAQLSSLDQLQSVLSLTAATFQSCVKKASPAWRELYQNSCKDKQQRTALWILWLERTINLI